MAAAPTTVSSYVKRFERRGHISRIPNAEDGRSYRVQLTAAGRDAHRHAGDLFAPILTNTEDTLGAHAERPTPNSSSCCTRSIPSRRAPLALMWTDSEPSAIPSTPQRVPTGDTDLPSAHISHRSSSMTMKPSRSPSGCALPQALPSAASKTPRYEHLGKDRATPSRPAATPSLERCTPTSSNCAGPAPTMTSTPTHSASSPLTASSSTWEQRQIDKVLAK